MLSTLAVLAILVLPVLSQEIPSSDLSTIYVCPDQSTIEAAYWDYCE